MVAAAALAGSVLGSTAVAEAAPPSRMPVYRAQLYVRVCDAKHAGTDKTLQVSLGAGNYTKLNYSHDDLERRSRFTYDLNLNGLSRIEHISRLQLARVGGDDAVKVCYAQLIVNGRAIYGRNFGSGLWLDADRRTRSSYTISRRTMSRSSLWRNYRQPLPPLMLSRAEIESRIESMIGHEISGTKVKWGGKGGRAYVEAKRASRNRVAVDLDLEYDLPGPFDPNVDVDFELAVTCSSNRLRIDVERVRVNTSWFWRAFDSIGGFTAKAERQFRNSAQSITADLPFCPAINVQSDGSVRFF